MQLNVHELVENFVQPNGRVEEGFKFYFAASQALVSNIPWTAQENDDEKYSGEVKFYFDY